MYELQYSPDKKWMKYGSHINYWSMGGTQFWGEIHETLSDSPKEKWMKYGSRIALTPVTVLIKIIFQFFFGVRETLTCQNRKTSKQIKMTLHISAISPTCYTSCLCDFQLFHSKKQLHITTNSYIQLHIATCKQLHITTNSYK